MATLFEEFTKATTNPITPLTRVDVWSRLNPLEPSLDADPSRDGLADLPYALLGSAGFERLCYELLVAEGKAPRFFGRNGQADLGVDIIVDGPESSTLYQCKNLSAAPTFADVRQAVERFERQWLGAADLPRPKVYIYCCPQPLDDKSFGERWSQFRDEFQDRTGVSLDYRDKNSLDARLRQAPDLVAGLFSPSYASHFCCQDDWSSGPWAQVTTSATDYPALRRFLSHLQQQRIYISEQERAAFDEILEVEPVALIRGCPGVGKSTTGLALSCTLRDPIRRIYYTSLSINGNLGQLVEGIKRRDKLPSIFFLDDCHHNPKLIGDLLNQLHPVLNNLSGRIKLVLCQRDVPDGAVIDETRDWLNELTDRDCVLTLRGELKRFREILRHRRKDLVGLSQERIERLHYQTGGDLLLLDEILEAISSPADLDQLRREKIYRSIRGRYFEPIAGHNRPTRQLPTVLRLACLAQFELVPLAAHLSASWLRDEQDVAAPLMIELYGPRRYLFLHASMAELVAHALIALDAEPTGADVLFLQRTRDELLSYLAYLAQLVSSEENWIAALKSLVHNPLRLVTADQSTTLKATILADPQVLVSLEHNLKYVSFIFLGVCLKILHSADHPSQSILSRLVCKRFHLLFELKGEDRAGLETIGYGFYSLAKYAPGFLRQVEQEHPLETFLQLIVSNGTLFELFRVLQYASPIFRSALVDALDKTTAIALVDKTIVAGRSVGTLSFTLRELGKEDPTALESLETLIGAGRYLQLIVSNGTLFELFRVLQYASPSFRSALVDALDKTTAIALVDKTIVAGRSVGTLSFTLRELGKEDPTALESLETLIGAGRYLQLIVSNGTLFELFRVLQYASPSFRSALLGALDKTTANALVDKTIAAGRSVGTLHLSLRELGQVDPTAQETLETIIGAGRYLQLIVSNGTLFELFKVLQYASPSFRSALLGALDKTTANALVAKTIGAERSFENIGQTFRAIARNTDHRRALEMAIGAHNWWQMILVVGTLHSLNELLAAMSTDGRHEFILKVPSVNLEAWRALICRGHFSNAIQFLAGPLTDFDLKTQATITAALESAADDLAARSSWLGLRLANLEQAGDSQAGLSLKKAWQKRIKGLEPECLVGLNFSEAINGFALAWQHRPDLHAELASRCHQIIPSSREWPRQKGGIAAFSFVLTAAFSDDFPAETVLRLANEIAAFLEAPVCKQTHTKPLFLLAWNLAAVHIQHKKQQGFKDALSADLSQTLFKQLEERIKVKNANIEKRFQFSLAGLLSLVAPKYATDLSFLLRPLNPAIPYLEKEALAAEVGFVTARITFLGFDLASPFSQQRNSHLRRIMSVKYQQMEVHPRAVGLLASL